MTTIIKIMITITDAINVENDYHYHGNTTDKNDDGR